LILVDSSVWIDFSVRHRGAPGDELRRMISEAEPFVLTGVVVAEILQGLTRDASRIEHYVVQGSRLARPQPENRWPLPG